MYFADQLTPGCDKSGYDAILRRFADLIVEAIKLLREGWKIAEVASFPEQKHHHVTVQVLTRHVCEFLDGVSVLAEQGCGEPAKPLLRSAFEAMLGIQYILEADSERRGLAYQVAHAHRRMSLYRKLDPDEQAGKELRKTLANDPLAAGMQWPTVDMKPLITNFDSMVNKPEFVPINQEWLKHKGRASWFSLFGGPRDIRALALHLKHAAMYEFLYRHWSNSVHAGDCFSNVAGKSGAVVIRPIRHPEGLQQSVVMAVGLCLSVNRILLDRYGTAEQKEESRGYYVANIQDDYHALWKGELIRAQWK
jgi:hypothetical protein